MPAISSGKVLVTGANGFVATWTIQFLLEHGFSVRGAVRSDGAFDAAVQGVDAIEHIASPYHLHADEPEVQGTLGVFQSAQTQGKSIKRIVMTSSSAAVLQIQVEPKMFSEPDWNEQAPKEAAELGREAPPMTKYRASKALQERAAWDFVETYKSELNWDLAVLNPPFVFGPPLQPVSTPDELNTSSHQFYTMLTQPSSLAARLTGACWVDVRDIAYAHVLALLKPDAGGERIIVSAGAYVWQNWREFFAAPESPKCQKGTPGARTNVIHQISYDTSKSVRVLGMTHDMMDETARDTIAQWEARGW
ncbi:D-lactaldehyde dehydrogenase [Mycena crocata]|nr:D-lactaldehyde dehydrogenase [Mycena crocata]